MSNLRKSFGNLINEVISYGSCSRCGACVVVCPYNVLRYIDGRPQQMVASSGSLDHCIIDDRLGCGACALVCPRLNPQREGIERAILGKSPGEQEFGIFRRLVAARSTDHRVLEVCQDGGVVTTLLAWLLDQKVVDGAVVSSLSGTRPCDPVPKVVTTYEELIGSAGSWYTYCPNPLGLREALEKGLKKVALVGVPCQIEAIRKMERLNLKGLVEPAGSKVEKRGKHLRRGISSIRDRTQLVAFTIGLFCSQCFTYEGLMEEKIGREVGLSLEDVAKINIKGKVLVHLKSGGVVEIPLEEAKAYTRPECRYCGDFSAELADISAGGVGTTGWTITILRTKKGEQIFDQLVKEGLIITRPIEGFETSLKMLRRLSRRQRKRSASAYGHRKNGLEQFNFSNQIG